MKKKESFWTAALILAVLIGLVVTMGGCPPPTPGGPEADFRADATSGPAPLTVQFTDLSSPGASPITSWYWLFGDGAKETSAEQNPVHTYNAAGTYNVSLAVTTANGEDTELKLNFISVTQVSIPPASSIPTILEGTWRADHNDGSYLEGYRLTFSGNSYENTNTVNESQMRGTTTKESGRFALQISGNDLSITFYEMRYKYSGWYSDWYSDLPDFYDLTDYDPPKVFTVSATIDTESNPYDTLFYCIDCQYDLIYIRDTAGNGEGEGEPGQPETILLPGDVPLEMVWIPAGSFMMGRSPAEQDSDISEDPQHSVTLSSGFWMGKYELTKAQWTAVMGTTPWSGQSYVLDDPNSPAVYVYWKDAQAFMTALNTLTGKTFRLPSEAEWEYACRAGTTTRFYWGDDANYTQIGSYAWNIGNCYNEWYAHIVGLKLPNAWGLYDMSGNVSEWCQDWYGDYPIESVTDPTGPSSGDNLVIRGGSWYDFYESCRSSKRRLYSGGVAMRDLGFRVAQTP